MIKSKIIICLIALVLWANFVKAAEIESEDTQSEDTQVEPVKQAPVKKKVQSSKKKKLKQIDAKILQYEQEKSTGITCFWVGLAAEALSFVFLPTTEIVDDNSYWGFHTEESGNSALYYGLLAGGAITATVGAYMWYEGANGIQIWESKRMDISMGIVLPKSLSCKNTIGIGLTARF